MFDKIYPKRKDIYKRYYGVKAFNRLCEDHKTYYLDSRMHSTNRKLLQFSEFDIDINNFDHNI